MRRYSHACLLLLLVLFPCASRAEDRTALLTQAESAYASGQYSQAADSYRKVVESSAGEATRAYAQKQIGYAWYKLGERAKARIEWEAVYSRFPEEATSASDALLRAANCAFATNDYAGGIRLLDSSVAAYAHRTEVLGTMAETLLRLGLAHMHEGERLKLATPKNTSAALAWDRGAESFRKARSVFQRISKDFAAQTEQAAEAELQLLALYYDENFWHGVKDMPKVAEEAARFISKYPADTKRLPVAYLLRAEALIGANDPRGALRDIEYILEHFPDTKSPALGTAMFLKGDCLVALHQYDAAIAAFRAFAISQKIGFLNEHLLARSAYLTALSMNELGRKEEAIVILEEVANTYPGTSTAEQAVDWLKRLREGDAR